MSADTIVPGQSDKAGTANPQNLNRYSYVNNDPIKNTDPSGHTVDDGRGDRNGPVDGAGGGGGPEVPLPKPPTRPVQGDSGLRGNTMESDGSVHPTAQIQQIGSEATGSEVGSGTSAASGNNGFSSGRPPHVAEVTVTRGGEEVYSGTFRSGGMTPEEAELGFPRSSLATHTEARAVRQVPLQPGDEMLIKGQYPPCPSCKGAMNNAARTSGANITYTWYDQIWIAGGKK